MLPFSNKPTKKDNMYQYSFENNQLKIKVSKIPFLIRLLLFIITFLCFALPLSNILLRIVEGNEIKLSGIVMFGIFCPLGFYLLRISLWNSYGEETIQFNKNQIIYSADYCWFKDGEKTLDKNEIIYSIKTVGNENDNNGILVISNGKSVIETVVKIPKQNLEKLIDKIQHGS